MAVIKTGKTKYMSYVAFAKEATFGTAIADDQVFTKFDIVGGDAPSFNPSLYIDEDPRNHEKNMADAGDYFSTSNGEWQRYTIPNFIAPADVLAKMIYGVTHSVSEDVGSPFLKTFTFNGAINPDFSSNAGFFYTLLIESPFASFAQKLTSCVNESVTITFSPDNGGRVICTANAATAKGYTGTSSPSGANVNSAVAVPQFFNATARTLSIDGNDMIWYNFALTIQSVYAWIGYTGGAAQNLNVTRQMLTASVTVKYDENSDYLLNQKGNLLTNKVLLTIDAADTAGYFLFDSGNGCAYVNDVTADRGADGEIQKLNLSLTFRPDYSATAYPVIKVVDGVDQGW